MAFRKIESGGAGLAPNVIALVSHIINLSTVAGDGGKRNADLADVVPVLVQGTTFGDGAIDQIVSSDTLSADSG